MRIKAAPSPSKWRAHNSLQQVSAHCWQGCTSFPEDCCFALEMEVVFFLWQIVLLINLSLIWAHVAMLCCEIYQIPWISKTAEMLSGSSGSWPLYIYFQQQQKAVNSFFLPDVAMMCFLNWPLWYLMIWAFILLLALDLLSALSSCAQTLPLLRRPDCFILSQHSHPFPRAKLHQR